MKRSFLTLIAGVLFLATPLAAVAADAHDSPSGPILLLTANSLNAEVTGYEVINNAFRKEVGIFVTKLKSLLENTGRTAIAKDLSNIELTNTGHPVAVALAGLLPQQMSSVGIVYWRPDEANNIQITVDFYSIIYTNTKGSFKLGDKNFGKKILFLASGSSRPTNTAEQLAIEFNEHLVKTVFNQ